MTDFEKYQASAEARRSTHGDHLDRLTGYFMAETNRMRGKHAAEEPEEPQQTPQPGSDPLPQPRKRFGWLRWWHSD